MFEYMPQGPFDLANQNQHFGGWSTLQGDPQSIVMAFPVEGWQGSAVVVLRQEASGRIAGHVHGPADLAEQAQNQALAALSLDIAAQDWPEVSRRDAVVGELQAKYQFLRPILFHSPYEAAAAFIIGHRISTSQRATIMRRMAQELGAAFVVEGQDVHAFPDPQILLDLTSFPGLSEQKVVRLHGVARAALDGLLDRQTLRTLAVAEALTRLESLPGVGPFFAQGILHRGAGVVDDLTSDDLTHYAIQTAYHLPEPPDQPALQEITRPWRPFRMWVTVLLHVWLRREIGLPKKRQAAALPRPKPDRQ